MLPFRSKAGRLGRLRLTGNPSALDAYTLTGNDRFDGSKRPLREDPTGCLGSRRPLRRFGKPTFKLAAIIELPSSKATPATVGRHQTILKTSRQSIRFPERLLSQAEQTAGNPISTCRQERKCGDGRKPLLVVLHAFFAMQVIRACVERLPCSRVADGQSA